MNPDGTKMKFSVTVIVENEALNDQLQAEHGLSMLIQAGGKTILFDTGQGDAFKHNIQMLGIDLKSIDALVLSHGHYDHTGGIAYVLDQNPGVPIYAHPAVLKRRYSIYPDKAPHNVAMPEMLRDRMLALPPDQWRKVTEPEMIAPGVLLSGQIPRKHPNEDTGGPFFDDAQGLCPDCLPDDMALSISTPQGRVIVCGCCHSGLLNTIHHFEQCSSNVPLHGLIGGLHLKNASNERLAATQRELEKLHPSFIVPNHCSGERIYTILKEMKPITLRSGSAGSVID